MPRTYAAPPVDVSVLVPYRPGGLERERSLRWLVHRYTSAHPSWEVVVASDEVDGGWSKGLAVARATCRAAGDILVVSDGDVWCDDVGAAVDAVRAGHGWAMPHDPVRRLDEEATIRVLAGTEPDWDMALERPQYHGVRGGGLVVVPRAAIAEAPMDPRFRGWGGEDIAWGDALRCLVGRPWRGDKVLWHLWHPPETRMSPYVGSLESKDLATRYRRFQRHPIPMADLVAEAHVALGSYGISVANASEGESNPAEGR